MFNRRRSPLEGRFRAPELLEKREMLHGHFLAGLSSFTAGGLGAQQASAISYHISLARLGALDGVFASLGSRGEHSHHDDSSATVLSASLTDSATGATASISYKTSTGEGETELKVRVAGAAANSTLDVSVGGTVVGQVTTNANGSGTLELSSNPDDDDQPLPTDFPSDIAAGTAVSVGTLSGTLAAGNTHEHHDSHTTLTASLTDAATGSAAKVTYKASTEDGETTLKVSVTGATANSTLDVAIGGVVVGQVDTDASGAGSLVLSSNPTGDEKALPDNFPTTVAAGDAIAVGAMTGTLAVPTRSNPHGHGCHGHGTGLSASLSDSSSSATGTATYRSNTHDGTTTTKLSVSVTGAAASSSLDVSIGSTVVGQLSTDAAGAGSLVMSSNPSANEQPLPANFPTTVSAGTTITVGSLNGSFAAMASKGGFRFGHFR